MALEPTLPQNAPSLPACFRSQTCRLIIGAELRAQIYSKLYNPTLLKGSNLRFAANYKKACLPFSFHTCCHGITYLGTLKWCRRSGPVFTPPLPLAAFGRANRGRLFELHKKSVGITRIPLKVPRRSISSSCLRVSPQG